MGQRRLVELLRVLRGHAAGYRAERERGEDGHEEDRDRACAANTRHAAARLAALAAPAEPRGGSLNAMPVTDLLQRPPSWRTTASRSTRWSPWCCALRGGASSWTARSRAAARKLSAAVAGGELSAVATTRLRLVRRLIFARIIVIGIALALAQFEAAQAAGHRRSSPPRPCSAWWWASPRAQTLANAIAGIMLAITQPIRIGDLVTVRGRRPARSRT